MQVSLRPGATETVCAGGRLSGSSSSLSTWIATISAARATTRVAIERTIWAVPVALLRAAVGLLSIGRTLALGTVVMRPRAEQRERAALERLASVYRGYRRSERRRRAWDPANAGNVWIRRELETALRETGVLEPVASVRTLDLGCGHGYWLRRLTELGVPPAHIAGVDALPERASSAARAVEGASVIEADAADLPLPSGSYDVVLLFTVLSSEADEGRTARILREARRVVAPGGAVLVYEPRIPNPLNRATRRIRSRELTAVLGSPVSQRTLTLVPPLARRLGGATDSLYPLLARVPLLRTHRLLLYQGD
jgi:SAM-dependent methyltransferase